jgi:hypothetical protein
MKNLLASFLLVSFILWILPLGYFITSSQEKFACDGQRAICMCHAMILKSSDKAIESGIVLKAGSSTNKENSSGGGSSYFVSAKSTVTLNLNSASILENQFLSYKSPFLAALEYVPKV